MDNYLTITNQQQIDAITLEQSDIITIIFDDWAGGNITSIPDNFFVNFPHIQYVRFNLDIEQIPSSLYKTKALQKLTINSKKFKSFPEDVCALKQLNELDFHYQNKQINWSKEFSKLAQLPMLKHLELKNLWGTSFPKELVFMKQLESLKINEEVFKKCDHDVIIETVAKLENLKKIIFRTGYKERVTIKNNFLALDFLEEIKFENQYPSEELPPLLALFKHTTLDIPFQRKKSNRYDTKTDSVSNFKQIISDGNYNNEQLQILFSCWLHNFHTLRNLLPNILLQPISHEITLMFIGKTKKNKVKDLSESLLTTTISFAKNSSQKIDSYVIQPSTTVEEIMELMNTAKTFILEDHVNEYIGTLGQHYLLEKENEELNEELIRLLASNQTENYLLAFQIIESGGANKTVQSMLAAIYLTHPDKKIQKEVSILYKKYCTVAYQEYADKNSGGGVSLRKSSSSNAAFKLFSNHPDINRMEFILMYHKIASENPVIKDIFSNTLDLKNQEIISLPYTFKFFNHINKLILEKNTDFDVKKSLPALENAPNIATLNLSGCHLKIPDLSSLKSIHFLDLSFNQIEDDGRWLENMNLAELNIEGCRIQQWNWLNKLQNLCVLNISGNIMTSLPEEIYTLPLSSLTARNNKLKEVDNRINIMPDLKGLDFSNNSITEFKSFLLKLVNVNLRSNNISQFETQKYGQELGNVSLAISTLNLANNNLSDFNLQQLQVKGLKDLDISGNNISNLDESIFNNTSLRNFEANNNQIELIPPGAVRHFYNRFWIEKNKIKSLPEYLNALMVGNFNLKNNLIEFVHPSFFTINQGYDRANWKIDGNPVCKTPGFSDYNFRYPGKS